MPKKKKPQVPPPPPQKPETYTVSEHCYNCGHNYERQIARGTPRSPFPVCPRCGVSARDANRPRLKLNVNKNKPKLLMRW